MELYKSVGKQESDMISGNKMTLVSKKTHRSNSESIQSSGRWLLVTAGIFGLTAVMLGAFAAHGLKAVLTGYLITVFETGVLYQFLHTLAIIACAILIRLFPSRKVAKWFFYSAICFIIGILFFSGSLYALALTGIKWFGPITPLGGTLFMIGWGLFVKAACAINEDTL